MASAALLGLTNYNSPLLRNAVPCALASLAVQYAVGLPSTFLVNPPSERYYDLTGALTNVAVAVLSLYLPRWRAEAQLATASNGAALTLESPNWHQVALSGAVVLWAARRTFCVIAALVAISCLATLVVPCLRFVFSRSARLTPLTT